MTSVQFCYWLQGFFEMAQPTRLNAEQTEAIRKRLAAVSDLGSATQAHSAEAPGGAGADRPEQ
jgi:hypothetical protein